MATKSKDSWRLQAREGVLKILDEVIAIEIPADEDGFILFECPKCNEQFKVRPQDYEDDGVAEIWCPSCGLTSESYLTEDVVELAKAKLINAAMDELHKGFKKLERRTHGEAVSFKAGKNPKHEVENRLEAKIDALEVVKLECCGREVKIPPLDLSSVYYCPFCGVMHHAG